MGRVRPRRSTLRRNLGSARPRRSTLQPSLGNARLRDIDGGARKPTLGGQQSHHLLVRYFKSSHEGFEKSHLFHILNGIPNFLKKGFFKTGILLLLKFGLFIPLKVFQTEAQPRERSLRNICVIPSRRVASFVASFFFRDILKFSTKFRQHRIFSRDIRTSSCKVSKLPCPQFLPSSF